jgi:hypothetical protein
VAYNGLVESGRPFAVLAAAPGPAEKDGAAVAYVARLVLTVQQGAPRRG